MELSRRSIMLLQRPGRRRGLATDFESCARVSGRAGHSVIDTLSGYGFTTAGAPVHEFMFVEGHKHCSAILVSSTRRSAQRVMDSSPSEPFVRRGNPHLIYRWVIRYLTYLPIFLA